jgi:hypothetical protein
MLLDHGLAAQKISRTGYAGSDLSVSLLGTDRRVEVKAHKRGFGQLYAWLKNADLLILRADRCEPLVVLRLTLAAEIGRAAQQIVSHMNLHRKVP